MLFLTLNEGTHEKTVFKKAFSYGKGFLLAKQSEIARIRLVLTVGLSPLLHLDLVTPAVVSKL